MPIFLYNWSMNTITTLENSALIWFPLDFKFAEFCGPCEKYLKFINMWKSEFSIQSCPEFVTI